ncbi:TIGR01777 family oxidoreductase [Aneurinibacillus sp. REN35]|uniref:TIGR01777 family oxidoreductase n=1 Tax=Aneurinibacillus sp. REN35 TaxID=3237286 RepID=UPI0035272B18
MKVAIAGGSGFIGTHLLKDWRKKKHEIIVISRSCMKVKESFPFAACITWDELKSHPERLEGIDVLVNLAGESINSGRWTEARKQRILLSRVDTTQKIAAAVSQLQQKPDVVINGSAIGIYGQSDTARFDEDSKAIADDFLAQVSRQWEAEADRIRGVRLVKIRTGLVLGVDGGAFSKMALPYRMFAGGRVGSGRQWHSWIHIADYVRLINFCIENERMEGPVNATAPNPVTNEEFGHALARKLHRPHWLPVPGFVMALALGEMSELLLQGQHVAPKKAVAHGFDFHYAVIDRAIQDLVSKM